MKISKVRIPRRSSVRLLASLTHLIWVLSWIVWRRYSNKKIAKLKMLIWRAVKSQIKASLKKIAKYLPRSHNSLKHTHRCHLRSFLMVYKSFQVFHASNLLMRLKTKHRWSWKLPIWLKVMKHKFLERSKMNKTIYRNLIPKCRINY